MLELNMTELPILDELDVQTWHSVYWAELQRRISPLSARSDARERALAYLAGLLSPAERKESTKKSGYRSKTGGSICSGFFGSPTSEIV